jgi:N-acetylmuramoyl-L-alanine amidase
MKGISLIITYDSKKITCNYESFDAINTHKGLIFSFHNKEILQQLKLKTDGLLQYACNNPSTKPRIMLDYGHGGSDDGKVGCFNVKEKDINLEVGIRVSRLLSGKGYEVFSTRTKDCFVALDERTKYANQKNVDLFVSIHANAAQKSEIQGIETYWMNYDLFKPGMSLSDSTEMAKLNALKHSRSTQSQKLAVLIHEHVVTATKKVHNTIDRKVKQSVAQVLLGPEMPSALIEIGFLSNPDC